MRAKIKFYLKDKNKATTVLYISIHYHGKRYRMATGEKIVSEFWIQGTQKAKIGKQYEDGDVINSRLIVWADIIEKAFDKFAKDLNPPDQDDLLQEVHRLKDGGKEKSEYFTAWIKDFIPRSGRAYSTKLRYGTTNNLLKEYESDRKIKLRFKHIDINFYRDLKGWMEKNEYALNTFGTTIKHIKVFMNESHEELKHGSLEHLHNKFSTISETADTIYLSEQELLKIYNLVIDWEAILKEFPKISDNNLLRKMESYKVIRDRFLIGCFTALRVSDFSRLAQVNVKDGLIRIKPLKGTQKNEDVVIPIHWIIKEIISRGFDWNRKVYDQKINLAIKPICKMAGIKGKISLSRTEGGKLVTSTYDKWDLVTTHTARRSGATNMFKAGIPSLAIMMITGHRTEKSFLKYIKITQEENAEMLKDHPFFKR